MYLRDLKVHEQLAIGRFHEMEMWRAVERRAMLVGDEKTAALAWACANGAEASMMDYAQKSLEEEGTEKDLLKKTHCKTTKGMVRKILKSRRQCNAIIARRKDI